MVVLWDTTAAFSCIGCCCRMVPILCPPRPEPPRSQRVGTSSTPLPRAERPRLRKSRPQQARGQSVPGVHVPTAQLPTAVEAVLRGVGMQMQRPAGRGEGDAAVREPTYGQPQFGMRSGGPDGRLREQRRRRPRVVEGDGRPVVLAALGLRDPFVATVRTGREPDAAPDRAARNPGRLALIEAVTGPDDVPPLLGSTAHSPKGRTPPLPDRRAGRGKGRTTPHRGLRGAAAPGSLRPARCCRRPPARRPCAAVPTAVPRRRRGPQPARSPRRRR